MYSYVVLHEEIAGMVLTGQQTRMLRNNQHTLSVSYVVLAGNLIVLRNSHIHQDRDLNLLLTSCQVNKFVKLQKKYSSTTVKALKLYDKNGIIKLGIGLVRLDRSKFKCSRRVKNGEDFELDA